MNETYKKIHIIGSVGSGKTTLAKKLSSSLTIPMYELDNFVWKRSNDGDMRRPTEQRDEYLNNTIQLNQWIIEGAQHLWVNDSFHQAELIILLDVPYRKRVTQIVKRHIYQKLGIERTPYKPTFHMLKKMFEWNAGYEHHERKSILEMLEPYTDKLLIIKNNKDVRELLTKIESNKD